MLKAKLWFALFLKATKTLIIQDESKQAFPIVIQTLSGDFIYLVGLSSDVEFK